MRFFALLLSAAVLGLILGAGMTIAEFGFAPAGGDRPIYGSGDARPVAAVNPPGVYPKVVVVGGERDFDFGRAEKDVPQKHNFALRNEGKGVLTLTPGQSSCSCTVASIDRDQLATGESTTITVEWHGKAAGPFRQSANILTNDPDRENIELIVTGEITAEYQLQPDRLTFGGFSSADSPQASTDLLSFSSSKLSVTDWELTDHATESLFDVKLAPLTAAQLAETAGAKSGVRLAVHIKPGLPPGTFRQTIQLTLNLPDQPTIELPVEGQVTGPIDIVGANWNATESSVTLPGAKAGQSAKAQLMVMLRGGADPEKIKVARVEPS